MPARSALFVSVAVQTGCFAGVVPPSRTEVGTTVIADGGRPQNGIRFATGAHLASGQTAPDRKLDIGVGVVYERLAAPPVAGEARALGDAPPMEVEAPSFVDAKGSYIDVAGVLQRAAWYRTWIGARSELMTQVGLDGERRAIGATYARVAWETYAPVKAMGSGSDSSGAFGAGFAYGAFALGLFLESGIRYGEGEKPAFVAIGGMSLRMPWLGGFVFDPTPKW